MPDDITGFDPARDVQLDLVGLRALAHPLRVRLLGRLRLYGPATASRLAHDLGESSGATSYHLRQLELHGFIEEDPERGTKRERWWRSVHRGTRFDMTLNDENRETGGQYLRAVARSYSERMLDFADIVEDVPATYGPDWADACTLSDWLMTLTAERAKALNEELFEVLARYRDRDEAPPPEGARKFVAQVQLFPLAPLPES